jgi:hypothetical protein
MGGVCDSHLALLDDPQQLRQLLRLLFQTLQRYISMLERSGMFEHFKNDDGISGLMR